MSSFYTTFAAVAEDQYRRERAAAGLRAVDATHHHGRFPTWRAARRRDARPAGK